MPRLLTITAFVVWGVSSTSARSEERVTERPLTFEADIRPILKAHCFQCHGEEADVEGNLDLRLVRLMVAGGDSGAALVAGKPDESLLIKRISSKEMPPGEKKLAADEIALMRRWIEQGGRTARPEPQNVAHAEFTDEERAFWSFQSITSPVIPQVRATARVRTPIDAFLLERLEREQLGFSPEADRATLIRRACFDLWGLPPAPERVAEFVADQRPDAWERLIDELLESPYYGERWGRHWLDIAGYADSDGYGDKDLERAHAYRYRDYVIRAFNDDKPFDQFIQEQLAGDELIASPLHDVSPTDAERLIATGFLRMGPDGTGDTSIDDQPLARQEVLTETIKIVSTALLGLSVGCAQCHNHRYDPISHEDYFRLRALFEPAYNPDPKAWRTPEQRLVSLWTAEERERAADVESRLRELAAERDRELKQQWTPLFEQTIAALPEEVRESVGEIARQAAFGPPVTDKTAIARQQEVFKKHPTLKFTSGAVAALDKKRYEEEQKAYEAAVAAIKAESPQPNLAHALTEVPGVVPRTHLFLRGDFKQPAHEVPPGELSILVGDDRQIVPVNDPQLPTSGRRLAYARHLTSGEHPLLTRVLVNRFWMHHFGRGIVATPADFGFQGDPPTHPELLDWLASEFVRGGWSLKKFHRLVMTSTAYRQRSLRTDQLEQRDGENRLLGRMNVRRLEAEVIRDAILAVAGRLNDARFGPPLPVVVNPSREVVIGAGTKGRDHRVVPLEDNQANRRSVYIQVRRSMPLGMLEAFDAPLPTPNCEQRDTSTVAPQSLLLMNNEFVIEQSEHFARRVINEAGDDPSSRIRRAWNLALGIEPTETQISRAVDYLETQHHNFATRPRTDPQALFTNHPAGQALASFCQFLFSSNAFLYVD